MSETIELLLLTGVVSLEHDYRHSNAVLRSLLESTGRFHVTITEATRGITNEFLAGYDAVFINYDGKAFPTDAGLWLGNTTGGSLSRFVQSGKGVVFYHSSLWMDDEWPDEYKRMAGGWLSTPFGSRRSPMGEFVVTMQPDGSGISKCAPAHWMTVEEDLFAGIQWHAEAKTEAVATVFDDIEAYRISGFPPAHHPVVIPEGKLENMVGVNTDMPVAWTNRYGDGRSFAVTIGHNEGTIQRHGFMSLLLRGVEWAATGKATIQPPDRSGDRRLRPWPYY